MWSKQVLLFATTCILSHLFSEEILISDDPSENLSRFQVHECRMLIFHFISFSEITTAIKGTEQPKDFIKFADNVNRHRKTRVDANTSNL